MLSRSSNMFLMVSVNPHSPFFLIFRIFLLHNIAYELSVKNFKRLTSLLLQIFNTLSGSELPLLRLDGVKATFL